MDISDLVLNFAAVLIQSVISHTRTDRFLCVLL